jgi:hypothetical protein
VPSGSTVLFCLELAVKSIRDKIVIAVHWRKHEAAVTASMTAATVRNEDLECIATKRRRPRIFNFSYCISY